MILIVLLFINNKMSVRKVAFVSPDQPVFPPVYYSSGKPRPSPSSFKTPSPSGVTPLGAAVPIHTKKREWITQDGVNFVKVEKTETNDENTFPYVKRMTFFPPSNIDSNCQPGYTNIQNRKFNRKKKKKFTKKLKKQQQKKITSYAATREIILAPIKIDGIGELQLQLRINNKN